MRFAQQGQQEQGTEQSSKYLNPSQLVGHLLLVWPLRYEEDTYTKYPKKDDSGRIVPSDAVYCDVVVLTLAGEDGHPGYLMRGAKWTQGRLIRETKRLVGSPDPLLIQIKMDGDAYDPVFQDHFQPAIDMALAWEARNPQFRPGVDQPQPRVEQQGPIRSAPPYPESFPMPQQQSSGVWPPASGPPAVPATPVAEDPMSRLRRQMNAPNPYVPSTLPPPPPAQEETPPF
jgi:hypothetical protein